MGSTDTSMMETRGRDRWERRDPFAQVDGAARRKYLAGRLIALLKRLMDKYEALSLVVGNSHPFVIGKVGGDRREWIFLWSGDIQIRLHEEWIDRIDEQDERVIVHGSFEGRTMFFKPYYRNRTKGMMAADDVGGDAGWLCDCIDRLQKAAGPDECVWVTVGDWGPKPKKMQWFEFDDRTGEVVLVTGRLDMLRKARLRASTLGDADTEGNMLKVLAVWGEVATIFVGKKDLDQIHETAEHESRSLGA